MLRFGFVRFSFWNGRPEEPRHIAGMREKAMNLAKDLGVEEASLSSFHLRFRVKLLQSVI